jgi:hypothetical protein
MSCILRISGTEFDIDDYFLKTDWKDAVRLHIHHIGDERSKTGRFPPHEDNGFSLQVSGRSFEDFEAQQNEAIEFLTRNRDNFLLLKEYKIDGWNCIDFGLSTVPPNNFSRTYIILPQLAALAAEYGLEIWMSNYFTDDSNYLKRKVKKRWPIRKK